MGGRVGAPSVDKLIAEALAVHRVNQCGSAFQRLAPKRGHLRRGRRTGQGVWLVSGADVASTHTQRNAIAGVPAAAYRSFRNFKQVRGVKNATLGKSELGNRPRHSMAAYLPLMPWLARSSNL